MGQEFDLGTQVGHCKQDAEQVDVYVGRGYDGEDMLSGLEYGERGWLGNPYTLDEYSREASVAKFRAAFKYALELNPHFREAVGELAGQTLGCWCQRIDEDSPACHGEVIAEFAEQIAKGEF